MPVASGASGAIYLLAWAECSAWMYVELAMG
jgi:hypothetical protein